ncbi:MAG: serine hydrolase, partial [Acetobacteraceae bacterium]
TGVPGMAIAVVHRDQVVYIKGFGVREAGRPAPVDADTIFPLASVSKPIASTVVAALVGDGVVTWDDPLVRHDPGFEMYDPWVTREVTLRDMFAHRSGLPDHAGDALEDIGYARAAILYRLRYQKPNSSFRTRYAYTNFGLTAAAVAAATASGKSWEDLSAERLYRPLGMRRTSSRFADFIAHTNRAHGHVKLGGKWIAKYTRDPDPQSPAGGVTSSVRDLGSWLILQLGRGRFAGKEIIKQAGLDETHIPQIVRPPLPANPALDHAGFYGLGWNVNYDDEGRVRWGHSGAFNLGNATCVSLLPGEQLAIASLTNAQPIGVPEAVNESFFDLFLTGKVQRDWLSFFGQLFTQALAPDYGTATNYAKPPAAPSPPLSQAAYTGAYANALFGDIEIVEAGRGLMVRLGPRHEPFALKHFDRDVFTYQPTGEDAYGPAAVTFTVQADRRAREVTIENLNLDGQGTFRRVMSQG